MIQVETVSTLVVPATQSVTTPTRTFTDSLSPKQRQQMTAFKVVLSFIEALTAPTNLQRIEFFQALIAESRVPHEVTDALKVLCPKKKVVALNRATLYRWQKRYESFLLGNKIALTKQYQGRQRTVYGWEQKAIELFNQPSKPEYATVAFWLRTDYGFETATKRRVTDYLKTLPATLGQQSPQRMGKQFYKHNLAPHKIRDNDLLPVGFGYEGDGHTVDAYVAHPATGNLYRPELTIWIDVRSRMVVGWYLSDAESSISTLFALSEALLSHDHVPAVLFLDNGSGFKSRMMADEVTGFLNRMDITPSFCLPGNSKGKGLCEGFFKLFRNLHDKKFQTYCGDDMAPEINRRLPEMVKNGKRTLPSLKDYAESVRKFIIDYNNEPKPVLADEAPLAVWTRDLKQVPVHITADALVRPRELRTVRKWRIRLDNRVYQAAELAHYNGEEVIVEFSLHHDDEIRVLDDKERLICIAKLVSKVDRLPDSRIVEAEQRREKGQIKRLENKIREVEQRNKPIISLEDSTRALNYIDVSEFSRVEQEEPLAAANNSDENATPAWLKQFSPDY